MALKTVKDRCRFISKFRLYFPNENASENSARGNNFLTLGVHNMACVQNTFLFTKLGECFSAFGVVFHPVVRVETREFFRCPVDANQLINALSFMVVNQRKLSIFKFEDFKSFFALNHDMAPNSDYADYFEGLVKHKLLANWVFCE